MGVTTVEAEKRLAYSPEALCDLVGDVNRYPEFIPWIQRLRLTDESTQEGTWRAVAHVEVGWRQVRERFATRIRKCCAAGEVDVSLVHGPLRTLENRWRFRPDGTGGALVKFWIAYDFKNPLFNAFLAGYREKAAARIMAAFEAEAQRRYGAPVNEL